MIAYRKEQKFNTAEFIIDTLPETCGRCPVGYSCNHDNDGGVHIPCGRRIPLDSDCRSPECKLRSIEQWLREFGTKSEEGTTRT